MNFTKPMGGPGRGLDPQGVIVYAKAQEAIPQYYTCMFDLTQTAATSIVPGHETDGVMDSVFNSVRLPDVAGDETDDSGLNAGFFGIAQEEATAAGQVIRVMICGITTARVDGNTLVNHILCAAADGELDIGTGISAFKVIAVALTADTANLATVIFSGIYGFGVDGGDLT